MLFQTVFSIFAFLIFCLQYSKSNCVFKSYLSYFLKLVWHVNVRFKNLHRSDSFKCRRQPLLTQTFWVEICFFLRRYKPCAMSFTLHCMLLVNSQLGSDVSGHFALLPCFLFCKPSLSTFLLSLSGMSLYVICFVLLKGSFRSLQVTRFAFSPLIFFTVFFRVLPWGQWVCLIVGSGLCCGLGVSVLAVVVISQAVSRMSMSRLWRNQH